MSRFPRAFVRLVWLLAGLGLVGCSKPVQKDEAESNLYIIAQAYGLAMAEQGRPPRNVDELKRWIKEVREAVGRDPGEILISPRDGQPYVIIYGVDLNEDDRNNIVVYEKTGADGQRYVLRSSRYVNVLTDEEFANASFAKNHKPGK